ncbi:MAG: phosphotransferase, partial [Chloroflexia bacterium]|nr:phosphotransferase [Chloroflexia bacterium]
RSLGRSAGFPGRFVSPGLDLHAVMASLGVPDPDTIVPVAAGFGDSANWRVETGGTGGPVYALRLFAEGDARTFRRERAAMDAVRDRGVPVPVVHATTEVEGRAVMLLDWRPGRTILEELMRRPDLAWSLGVVMGRAHGALHLRAIASGFREHGRDWIAWAGPEEVGLQERVRHASARNARPATVLHLDFHPANVLVEAGRVTGIIDWANAGVGDVRADVARTASILRFAPVPPGAPRARTLRLRRLFRRGWRSGHRRVVGHLPEMDLFDTWALAVMLRDLGQKFDGDGRASAGLSAADLIPIQDALARRKARLGIE